MSVINTKHNNKYTAQGIANEVFPITFDYNSTVSAIQVIVNDALLDLANYTLAESNNGEWSITIGTGHTLTAGDAVEILRVTSITQAIDYQQGSAVPQKHLVTALDKITFILQENEDEVDDFVAGLVQRVRVYYGFTAGVLEANATTDPAIIGPLAFASMNNANTRTQKVNNDLNISPALIPYIAPNQVGRFYYPCIALIDSWINIHFTELGAVSQLWRKHTQAVDIGGVVHGVWFRTHGLSPDRSFPVVVNRYE